jgi:hypothetical protein
MDEVDHVSHECSVFLLLGRRGMCRAPLVLPLDNNSKRIPATFAPRIISTGFTRVVHDQAPITHLVPDHVHQINIFSVLPLDAMAGTHLSDEVSERDGLAG